MTVNNQKGDRKMSENKIPYKIYLDENEMPKSWYNVRADMKNTEISSQQVWEQRQ